MSSDLDQFERLERLRASGALTDAEFDVEKARLLAPAQSSFAPNWRFVGRWLLVIAVILAIAVAILLVMPAPSRDAASSTRDDPTVPTSVASGPVSQSATTAATIDESGLPDAQQAAVGASAGAQAIASPAPKLTKGRCQLRINGADYIVGPCWIELQRDGSFSIFERANRTGYFAVLLRDGPMGNGYWNGSRDSTHAQAELGQMNRNGACWENAAGKICAWS